MEIKQQLLSYCLIVFILAGNTLINTDHISRVSIYKNTYVIHFDYCTNSGEESIIIRKDDAPDLIKQLMG